MTSFEAMGKSRLRQAGWFDPFGRFHLVCRDGYFTQSRKGKPIKSKPGIGPDHDLWKPISPYSS